MDPLKDWLTTLCHWWIKFAKWWGKERQHSSLNSPCMNNKWADTRKTDICEYYHWSTYGPVSPSCHASCSRCCLTPLIHRANEPLNLQLWDVLPFLQTGLKKLLTTCRRSRVLLYLPLTASFPCMAFSCRDLIFDLRPFKGDLIRHSSHFTTDGIVASSDLLLEWKIAAPHCTSDITCHRA